MPRILFIDDDEWLLDAAQRSLSAGGHTVLVARNGAEGLGVARADRVDLIVVDLFMPEKDGFEFIAESKRCVPAVPVIATSGAALGGFDLLQAARMLGAVGELRKPFGSHQLLDAVALALRAHPH